MRMVLIMNITAVTRGIIDQEYNDSCLVNLLIKKSTKKVRGGYVKSIGKGQRLRGMEEVNEDIWFITNIPRYKSKNPSFARHL